MSRIGGLCGRFIDRRLKFEFHGSRITSDAGLLAYRELDEALGLTTLAGDVIADSRTGKNGWHGIIGLLRQSVYGRLAGYEDVNDADRLPSGWLRSTISAALPSNGSRKARTPSSGPGCRAAGSTTMPSGSSCMHSPITSATSCDPGVARCRGAMVADDAEGEAGQDRGQGRPPRPLRHLPDGRGRHPSRPVPKNPAADRPTATTSLGSRLNQEERAG